MNAAEKPILPELRIVNKANSYQLVLICMISMLWQKTAIAQIQVGIRFDGFPVLTVNGPTGAVCQVQWSDDPSATIRWFHLGHIELTNGQASLPDLSWSANNARFYRAVKVPSSNMVIIPAGKFQMGDSFLHDGDYNELPVHTVYVSAFYLDQTEVTKAQWDDVYQWATNHDYIFDETYPADGKGADYPVEGITWFDAVKWCNARSEMEGRTPAYWTGESAIYKAGFLYPIENWNAGYRLPTEAEWEKAARGGATGERFPFGNTISFSQANYNSGGYDYDLSGTYGYNPAFNDGVMPYTNPVRCFSANAFGLYGMAGNVAEWSGDWFDINYYASSPEIDPHGSSLRSYLVIRGGGYYNTASECRVARRIVVWQSEASINTGFRCVLPLIQP